MGKYLVKYKISNGPSGDKVVEASSASEARSKVKDMVQHQNPDRSITITEVKER